MQFDQIRVDLAEYVLEIIGVKADLHLVRTIFARQLFRRRAIVGRGNRQSHLVGRKTHLNRARFLGRDCSNTVNTLEETLRIDFQQFVIALGNHAAVIGERSIDQFRGEDNAALPAKSEADFAGRKINLDIAVHRLVQQFAQLSHGFARDNDIGHAFCAIGPVNRKASKAVAIGRCGFQDGLIIIGNMQENAIEVIARFLGRDGKPRAVDQFGQKLCRQLETGGQIALYDHGKVITRKRRQLETASPGLDLHPVLANFKADLGAIGQFARNVEQ